MDKSIMIAYAEVEAVLNLMEEKYRNRIPLKMRKLISENKMREYNVDINTNISLKSQNISRKALAILAVLNYKYWCEDENKKNELIEKYKNNERCYQQKQKKLYNPDDLFIKRKKIDEQKEENKQLMIYSKKENCILKIFNRIKKMLKLT